MKAVMLMVSGDTEFLSYVSTNIIYRNCVARQDAVDEGGTVNPMAVFSVYDSNNVLVQNCIAIDANDLSSYVNGVGQYGGCFAVYDTTTTTSAVTYTNSICLNSLIGGNIIAHNNPATNISYSNDVFWNVQTQTPASSQCGDACQPRGPILYSGATSASFTNLTAGDITDANSATQNSLLDADTGTTDEYSSLFIDNTLYSSSVALVKGLGAYNYNDYYSNTASITKSSNDITSNPSLQWPVISCTTGTPWNLSGSTVLCGNGQSGGNIGANLIYQQGASGTLWGQTGYNLQQDGTNGQATVLMWPFPNEALIKTQMAAYNNATYGVTGARGFAASGNGLYGGPITLTSYIWESLGKALPGTIYNIIPAVTGFTAMVYTVTASAGTGGSVTPSSLTVPSGAQVTFVITPSTGYQFSGLTVNGAAVTATAAGNGTYTYSIPSVQQNYTAQATFTSGS